AWQGKSKLNDFYKKAAERTLLNHPPSMHSVAATCNTKAIYSSTLVTLLSQMKTMLTSFITPHQHSELSQAKAGERYSCLAIYKAPVDEHNLTT
ncbi:hypothetical protein AVEN_205283-1, partial [Araneus ventricosus]